MWLLTSSLNVLSLDWDPSSTSTESTLTIKQTYFSDKFQTLRYHMLRVAFFREDGSYTTQKVLVRNTPTTIVTYDASEGVKAVLMNEGHEDFVKCIIDDYSLLFF